MDTKEELMQRGDFGNNLVYQHNNLIAASYDLTVTEKKLLLGCISKINSFENITSDTPFSFDIYEAEQVLGLDLSNSGSVALYRKAAKGLMTKVISNDEDKNWMDTTFAQTSKYDYDNKTMTIYFSVGVIPYLSNLHDQFTKYRLMHVGRLESKYSIRLYEFVVMWIGKNYGKKTIKKFTLEEFDQLLSTKGTSYLSSSITMFKRRVVDLACDQITAETDVSVTPTYKKTGRKITHVELEFFIKNDWKKAEIEFKQVLSDDQISKIVNDAVFFKNYYPNYQHLGGVSEFFDEAKRLLAEDPKKHFSDYADYLKDK
jgi:plasmid replication initiation protein